jgi:hypothetical protein
MHEVTIMKKDRQYWTVSKVTFDEAEEIDNNFYASLSKVERLEILMDLRSTLDPGIYKIEKVVFKRNLYEEKFKLENDFLAFCNCATRIWLNI